MAGSRLRYSWETYLQNMRLITLQVDIIINICQSAPLHIDTLQGLHEHP